MNHQNNSSAFQAAVFGSMLGSAITAGIFLLKNKEERDRIFESIDNALGTAQNKTKELRKQADAVQDSAETMQKDMSKKVQKARKSAEDKIAEVTSTNTK